MMGVSELVVEIVGSPGLACGMARFAEGEGDEGVEDGCYGEGDEDPEVVEEQTVVLVFDVYPALRCG